MLSSKDQSAENIIPSASNPLNQLPVHVAMIMDGNGRWANERKMPRIMGHKKGAETVRMVVSQCASKGIKNLTLYAFSTENWKRPKAEVEFLMGLLDQFLDSEAERMRKEGVKFHTIGDLSALPPRVISKIDSIKEKTRDNTVINLIIALNYGSRQEILRAVNKLIVSTPQSSLPVTEADFEACLDTHGLPDPDLLIRTSGEMRLSNFLLWQCSYSELYVSPKLWPEFTEEDFDAALRSYAARHRRFGGVS
ncbi:MAG: isoprenyl transferase [Candidatus Omnitrophica bacterium]|nr:isoprenyl transferase [Candidatus Omnitrophota bacterium]